MALRNEKERKYGPLWCFRRRNLFHRADSKVVGAPIFALGFAAMANIDINHLCRLAQLALNDAEHEAVRGDLERIIAMVDQMQAMNTDHVEPLAHPLDANQRLRRDEVTEVVDRERYQLGAPATQDGLYLVPRVVE